MVSGRARMRILFLISICVLMAGGFNAAWANDERCFDDWSVGAVVVKTQGLVSVQELTTQAAARLQGKIVKTTLCERAGGHVYFLVVRSSEGQLKTVMLDARRPFDE